MDDTAQAPTTSQSDPDDGDPATTSDPPTASGGLTTAQLAQLRDTLIAAHPTAVPELIAGDSFDALLASVAPARAAFARIAETATRGLTTGVPRGGSTRLPDTTLYEGLSPEGKIAAGLRK